MKTNKIKRIAAGVIALVVTLGIAGTIVFADNNDKEENAAEIVAQVPVNDKVENAAVKNETVYLFTDGSGEVSKTLVSDWLSNPNGVYGLKDSSTLTDIENVKGDEEFTDSQWNANGNDIYYQGTTDTSAPVGIKVTYSLDGTETSAKDIVGKSGKVIVKYEYINNAKVTVPTDSTADVYVPFLMATGMMLDNNNFKNIEVTGGKLVNDGDKSVIIGFGIPHASEMLGDSSMLNITIPEGFEFTADVTDFQLDTTYTIATNEIFTKASQITDVSGEKDKISGLEGQLTEALNSLVEGSTQLDTGLVGATQGITDINAGLQKLSSNNDALNCGAKQVFDTLLSTADAQLKAAGLTTLPALTTDTYSAILDKVITQVGGATTEAGVKITALKTQLDSYNGFYTSLNQYTAGVAGAYQGTAQLEEGLTKLSYGSKQLAEGISQLKTQLESTLSSISPLLGSSSIISEVASKYNNFSGITEGTQGTVKFIFKTTL